MCRTTTLSTYTTTSDAQKVARKDHYNKTSLLFPASRRVEIARLEFHPNRPSSHLPCPPPCLGSVAGRVRFPFTLPMNSPIPELWALPGQLDVDTAHHLPIQEGALVALQRNAEGMRPLKHWNSKSKGCPEDLASTDHARVHTRMCRISSCAGTLGAQTLRVWAAPPQTAHHTTASARQPKDADERHLATPRHQATHMDYYHFGKSVRTS